MFLNKGYFKNKKMKYFSLIFLLFSHTYLAKSQHKDTLVAKAIYSYEYIKDTANKQIVREEKMALLIGKNYAHYYSQDKLNKDTLFEKQMLTTGTMDFRGTKKVTLQQIYFNFKEKKMFIEENLMQPYLYEDTYPQLNWKILNETKKVDEVNLVKAEGSFKGRHYQVWFAPEIPISLGPWKLVGLPGLIFEATDKTGQIKFKLATLQVLSDKNIIMNTTSKRANIRLVSKKEYTTLYETMFNNPEAFLQSMGVETPIFNGKKEFKPKRPLPVLELVED